MLSHSVLIETSSIEGWVLLKGDKIWIPESMKPEIMEKIHYCHQRNDKCKLSGKSCIFWSGKIIQQCATCQEHQKSQGPETLMPHKIPVWPWQIVASNIFNLKGHKYLFIADFYSKYPFIIKLREFSSQDVISLTEHIFAEQGIPEKLISDNESHFSSLHFKEFAKSWHFEHIISFPRYLQLNGMVKQYV